MNESGHSFRIVVLSELMARPEYSATPEPPLHAVRIDRATLGDAMRDLGVTFRLEVPDPFIARRTLELSPLRLDSIKAFKAASLADQVPELRALRAVYGLLLDFEQRRRALPDTVAQIERALGPSGWAASIIRMISSSVEPAASELPPQPPAAPRPTPPARASSSSLDSLLDMVELPVEDAPAPAKQGEQGERGEKSSIDHLLSAVIGGPAKPGAAKQDSRGARAEVERAFSNVLGALLQHPEMLRLERAWQGLRLLVERNDKRSGAEVDLVPARPSTVLSALEHLALRDGGEADRSAIDLLVVDYDVDASARDRALLASWGEQAERLRAPLVAGADSTLLGFPKLENLASTRQALSNSEESWAVGLRALSGNDHSRWLMLALNGMLVRAPQAPESPPPNEPRLTESAGKPMIFAAAAFAPAILALQSFAAHGHPFNLRGAQRGATVITDLTMHEIGSGPSHTSIAVQALLEAEVQTELARLGIVALAAARNRDLAVIGRLAMLWRTRGPADSNAPITLGDQLFVGRIARAVEQLCDAIPAQTDDRAIREVAAVTLAELLSDSTPPAPGVVIEIANGPRRLIVTLKPHGYHGVSLEEITFQALLA